MERAFLPHCVSLFQRLLRGAGILVVLWGVSLAQSVRFRRIDRTEATRLMGAEWLPTTFTPGNVQKKPIGRFPEHCLPSWRNDPTMYEYSFTLADGSKRTVREYVEANRYGQATAKVKSIKVYSTRGGDLYAVFIWEGFCVSEAFPRVILHAPGLPSEGISAGDVHEYVGISPDGIVIAADGAGDLTFINIGRSQHITISREWRLFAEKEKLWLDEPVGRIPREYKAYAVRGNPNACILWFPPVTPTLGSELPSVYVLVEW